MEILKLFAPYGPAWLGGVLLVLIAFYFGRQFLTEYKLQNEHKANLDIRREERKQAESAHRWKDVSRPRWSEAMPSWRA